LQFAYLSPIIVLKTPFPALIERLITVIIVLFSDLYGDLSVAYLEMREAVLVVIRKQYCMRGVKIARKVRTPFHAKFCQP
jgi:hypothetical protein